MCLSSYTLAKIKLKRKIRYCNYSNVRPQVLDIHPAIDISFLYEHFPKLYFFRFVERIMIPLKIDSDALNKTLVKVT